MITFIKNLFMRRDSKGKESNDFSDFFVHAKSKEKAKVIRQVLREANEEQKELVKRYSNS